MKSILLLTFSLVLTVGYGQEFKRSKFDVAFGASVPIGEASELRDDRILFPADPGGFIEIAYQFNIVESFGIFGNLGVIGLLPNSDEAEEGLPNNINVTTETGYVIGYEMLGISTTLKAGAFRPSFSFGAGVAHLTENKYIFSTPFDGEIGSIDIPGSTAFAFSGSVDLVFQLGQKFHLGLRGKYFNSNLKTKETVDVAASDNKFEIINAGLILGWNF